MKRLRMGFIGCGPRAVSLLETCMPIQDMQITALCDRYDTLTQQAAAKLGNPDVKCYTDHRTMLRDAPIDAVYVVVEPHNLARICIEVLEAGKHVLSEVPMGFQMQELWDLVVAVERAGGLKYQLGEAVRYAPFIQAWKKLVADGTLGKVVHAEGQYLHGMTDDRYYMDADTGERLTIEQAKTHPNVKKSRFWDVSDPILYLPHELSPLLNVMDDRVVEVVGMSTGAPSAVHPWFDRPDYQVALLRTARDSILRLSACFTIMQPRKRITSRHWYSVMGTKGSVETQRADCDKMKLWLPQDGHDQGPVQEMMWDHDPDNIPAEARSAGHEGVDYWPVRHFLDAVLNDEAPEMDVYKAAEAAAPAILAAESIHRGSQPLQVPDFRPGPQRQHGKLPEGDCVTQKN